MDLKFKTMKKLILTLALAATVGTAAFATDNGKKSEKSSASVSYTVLNQFNVDFADAKDVSWTVTNNSQKADFTLNNVKMTAFYSLDGEYLGLTHNVDFKSIPAAAQKDIQSKYKDYTVGEVIKFETPVAASNWADRLTTGNEVEPVSYFVDLKNESSEILVRVSPQAGIYFFKQVK